MYSKLGNARNFPNNLRNIFEMMRNLKIAIKKNIRKDEVFIDHKKLRTFGLFYFFK